MEPFDERRWTRYGHDRVYMSTHAGVSCGYVDLKSRTVIASSVEFEPVLRDCLSRWCPDHAEHNGSAEGGPATGEVVPDQTSDLGQPSDLSTPLGIESATEGVRAEEATLDPKAVQVEDLVSNVAGAAARAKRNEVNAEAPIRNLVARVLGVKTDERSWRVGAKGEEKVAIQLAKLGDGWHRIHAVPIGDQGSDIDHVVVGPPGVFTLNAKRHPGGRAWVRERTVMVNGHRTAYLRNSRFEGARASSLLSAACGFPVSVRPVVVCSLTSTTSR